MSLFLRMTPTEGNSLSVHHHINGRDSLKLIIVEIGIMPFLSHYVVHVHLSHLSKQLSTLHCINGLAILFLCCRNPQFLRFHRSLVQTHL